MGRLARYSSRASDNSLWHRAMISPKVLLVPPAVLDGVLVDRLGKFIQFHHRF